MAVSPLQSVKHFVYHVVVPVPMNVTIQRSGDNKVLEVSWSAINVNSDQLLSYDIEYRVYKLNVPDLPSTIISVSSNTLMVNIDGVDDDTDYEARVRGVVKVAEDGQNQVAQIPTKEGPWSPWIFSQGRPDTGKLIS